MSSTSEQRSSTERPILIAGFGGIGDHIRCFALARHVAAQHPGVPIDFLCRSPADKLVPFVPELRAAFVDDTPHGKFGLSHKLRLAARLRREKYGSVYVTSRTLKAATVPFLAGIPERIGWFGEGRAILINKVRVGEDTLFGDTEKVCALAFENSRDAAGPLMPPRIHVDPDELAAWQAANLGGPPTSPVLAIAPGAYNNARLWPFDRFAEIARLFAARGWSIWMLGGPKEQAQVAGLRDSLQFHDFTATPLNETPYQLASATVFLGNDSGMLHIAGAVGTASVGIFGPTLPEVTGPRNPGVVGASPPAGSLNIGDITVARVEEVLLERFARMDRGEPTLA